MGTQRTQSRAEEPSASKPGRSQTFDFQKSQKRKSSQKQVHRRLVRTHPSPKHAGRSVTFGSELRWTGTRQIRHPIATQTSPQ